MDQAGKDSDPFMKANLRKDWLLGRWETESRVIVEIGKYGRGFKVRAFDKDDNEEFVVSKTSWTGKKLRFETYMPSTKFRTRNCIALISKNKLSHELTLWQTWQRVSQIKQVNQ
jgi:hypothetical protein